jgi:hypothetical protein
MPHRRVGNLVLHHVVERHHGGPFAEPLERAHGRDGDRDVVVTKASDEIANRARFARFAKGSRRLLANVSVAARQRGGELF